MPDRHVLVRDGYSFVEVTPRSLAMRLLGSGLSLVLALVALAPAAVADDNRSARLAVLPFTFGEGLSHAQAQQIAAAVLEEFMEAGSYQLVDRTMMGDRESERDMYDAGVTDLMILGKELSVQKTVVGRVSMLGGSWSINMKIVDVGTGHIDDTRSGSAEDLARCQIVARSLAREMLGKAVYSDEVRNQKELERRKNLESKWHRQKESLRVKFKRAKRQKGNKGRFYKVKIVNPLNEPVLDVRVQLKNADGSEVKTESIKKIRANKSVTRKIRWTAKGKPGECVVLSVGGNFERPKCKQCKGKGFRPCPLCRTRGEIKCPKCKGRGTLNEFYTVKEGEFERTRSRKVPCRACGGDGKDTCSVCKGKGRRICTSCHATGYAE